MTPRLIRFIHLLREQGLRISVAESLDALSSVQHIGLDDRELLRLGLRTALVKSQQDFATFEALFERFFTVARRRRKRRRVRQRQSPGQGVGERATPPSDGFSKRPLQPPPEVVPPAVDPASRDHEPGTLEEDHAQLLALAALNDMEWAWQQQLDAQPLRLAAASTDLDPSLAQTRLDREFPPGELADMYREVERIAARLLTRRALRYRRARHGRIDVRRTVLQGLRSGREVPFALAHRRRHIGKLRLILLCDVSGSVWQVSTFLLKLVHTLQSEFSSVRSFLFVHSIAEVTHLFERMRFPEDLDTLRQVPHLSLFGLSDFGRAFYQAYRDLLGDLTRETVVVILGDARNNAFDPQAWTLSEMRRHCSRIIWLNPEPRRDWNRGDAVMADYAPACDDVLECWTLEHLRQAADLLLLT